MTPTHGVRGEHEPWQTKACLAHCQSLSWPQLWRLLHLGKSLFKRKRLGAAHQEPWALPAHCCMKGAVLAGHTMALIFCFLFKDLVYPVGKHSSKAVGRMVSDSVCSGSQGLWWCRYNKLCSAAARAASNFSGTGNRGKTAAVLTQGALYLLKKCPTSPGDSHFLGECCFKALKVWFLRSRCIYHVWKLFAYCSDENGFWYIDRNRFNEKGGDFWLIFLKTRQNHVSGQWI